MVKGSIKVVVLAALAIGVTTTAAQAAQIQAGPYKATGGSVQIRGSRTDITSPAGNPSTFNILSPNYAWQSIISIGPQSTLHSVQVGYYQANGDTIPGCPTQAGVLKAAFGIEIGSSLQCSVIAEVGASGQVTHKYAVRKTNSNNGGSWGAFYEGTDYLDFDAGYDTAYRVAVGGYLDNKTTCNGNTQVDGTYPSSGSWSWTSDQYPNPTTWTTVSNQDGKYTSGGWTSGNAPSPFNVTFSC